jgi:hypothetical protein
MSTKHKNKRHVVLADLHGQLGIYENSLREADYVKGRDILVVDGDWTDIGPDSEKLWERIKKDADVILLGNHESAHVTQQEITPYDRSIDFTSMPLEMAEMVRDGKIKLAYVANGEVLITHAGVSEALLNSTMHSMLNGIRDPQKIADVLNAELLDSIVFDKNGFPDWNESNRWLFTSPISPLWWRPLERGLQPAKGLKQIAGHTPSGYYTSTQQMKLKQAGLILIDPYVRKHFHKPDYFSYGLVDENSAGEPTTERVSYRRTGIVKMVNPPKK